MSLTVITNNVSRELVYGFDIQSKELRAQFDYLSDEEFNNGEYFNYLGEWYSVGDFLVIDNNSMFDNVKWDGYTSETAWSGVLMKYCYNGTVIVGRFYS
jgi:hypothetical protein